MTYKPHRHTLRDGSVVELRQIEPEDKEALVDGLKGMSPRTRHLRFFTSMDKLSESALRYLTEIDHVNHEAWVAIDTPDGQPRGIGVARYIRLREEPNVAESAVTVVDDCHGRGIGTLLLGHSVRSALENGIDTFRLHVLGENKAMLDLLKDAGAHPSPLSQGPERVFDLPLAEHLESRQDSVLGRVFKIVAEENWEDNDF